MAEGVTSPAPEGQSPQPGAPPQGGASPGGQATGPGGATMPVPNRGLEGNALAILAGAAQLLQQMVLPKIPVASDAARDVRKAIDMLTKHVPQAEMSRGVVNSGMQNAMQQQRQMGPQIAAMRAAHPAMPQGSAPPQPMAA